MTAVLFAHDVCDRLGVEASFLQRLVNDGVVAPSGGGGGQRGRRHRWTEDDLGVLEVCQRLVVAGASGEVLARVVRFLHGVEGRVPLGALLVVGHTYGPRLMNAETFTKAIPRITEALIVLDVTPMRHQLSRRPRAGTLEEGMR